MSRLYHAAFAAVVLCGCASEPVSETPSPPCADHRSAVAGLARTYGEAPVAAGITESGAVLEIFTTPDGSTWTLLSIGQDGQACLVDTGVLLRIRLPATPGGET